MNTQIRTRAIRLSLLVPLAGALAFAATGLALAGAKAPQSATIGIRLTAQLTAAQETPASTGSTSAKGHFDALLVRSGPGQAAKVGSLPNGCKVVNPPRGSGVVSRIVCDNGRLTLPLPKVAGLHWTLAWRLTFSGLTGPGMAAHIHAGAKGNAGLIVIPLCAPCASAVAGVTHVTAAQAAALVQGGDYVNVHTAKNAAGEIRGQIERTVH
jgi:hypothetical protein